LLSQAASGIAAEQLMALQPARRPQQQRHIWRQPPPLPAHRRYCRRRCCQQPSLPLPTCLPVEQKAKDKLVEDKTFGLKNKGKSAKVQKFVQQLQKSAQAQTTRSEGDVRKVQQRRWVLLLDGRRLCWVRMAYWLPVAVGLRLGSM
jgi:hypothetical protein